MPRRRLLSHHKTLKPQTYCSQTERRTLPYKWAAVSMCLYMHSEWFQSVIKREPLLVFVAFPFLLLFFFFLSPNFRSPHPPTSLQLVYNHLTVFCSSTVLWCFYDEQLHIYWQIIYVINIIYSCHKRSLNQWIFPFLAWKLIYKYTFHELT